MDYVISIDWLAFYCKLDAGAFSDAIKMKAPFEWSRGWDIKREQYGTRQFRELHRVSLNGIDFAEIQSAPYSSILEHDSCVLRIVNERLYTTTYWYDLECLLQDFGITILSLSRVDLCADFNKFKCYECIPFINDFLGSKIRHIGRGKGAAYFDHFAVRQSGISVAKLKYSGLSFGSHESDVRAYLYNKTFELQTVKDKPYIKALWHECGLDVTKPIWRLEISVHSKGRFFKDKLTGRKIEVQAETLEDKSEIAKIYHTFVKKYFAFVKNRPNITNISREPRLELFSNAGWYVHGTLRNVTGGNRAERILIKQLWQMSEVYRGDGAHTDEGLTKSVALDLAQSCNLKEWLSYKATKWEKPTKK